MLQKMIMGSSGGSINPTEQFVPFLSSGGVAIDTDTVSKIEIKVTYGASTRDVQLRGSNTTPSQSKISGQGTVLQTITSSISDYQDVTSVFSGYRYAMFCGTTDTGTPSVGYIRITPKE